MLQAILHGKAGRIDGDKGESISWREVFKGRQSIDRYSKDMQNKQYSPLS